MESGNSCGDDQQGGTENAINQPTWIRRHLAGSIYLWACGEKTDDDEDNPEWSDKLIGWLILLVQGFAYSMLFVLSRTTLDSDADSPLNAGDSSYAGVFSSSTDDSRFTDNGTYSVFVPGTYYDYNDLGSGATDDSAGQEESPYVLPAMTGAMYLLIASTAHDFRAGFSLLVDGTCAGHRTFGVGLLIVHGVMITAAISVLLSTSQDSASVVLNAVTVIFIADLDEKALKFLSTIPRKWRLFWAIYTIGISFVLALLAAVYIGDGNGSYALKLSSTRSNLKEFPSWILWVLTPLCVTILAYGMSVCINRICMLPSESLETVQQQAFSCAVAFVRLLSIIKRAIECVRKEPYFYGASIVWVAQAIVWPFLINLGIPFAIYISVTYNDDTEEISSMSFVVGNTCLLVVQNAFFAAGLAMKVMGILLPRHRSVVATPEPWASSVTHGALLGRRVSRLDCRLSSFLIGWGVGYWVTSLFFVLMVAWDILGWYNLPTIVQVFTWLVLPCFVFTSIFMVADINFLGAQVGAFIKPAVESLQDRRGFLFWIMATVFRDAFVIWSYPVYIILIGYW